MSPRLTDVPACLRSYAIKGNSPLQLLCCRYNEGAGDVKMTPTQADDPCIFSPEGLSMDVRLNWQKPRGLPANTIKVQFAPPCLLRYFFPLPQVDNVN